MEKKIIKLLRGVDRPGIDRLIDFMQSSTYFTDPASAKNHSNFPGGLCVHSYSDLEIAYKLRNAFDLELSDESLIITALTHDFCKIGTYTIQEKSRMNVFGAWEKIKYYASVKTPGGLNHGEKSARMVSKLIELTDAEYEAISNHMSVWSYGVDKYALGQCYEENPLALILAMADQYSTFQVERTYEEGEIPF